jgi:hypothetical protein
MAHLFRSSDQKRVSLELLHARPNQPLAFGISGYIPELKILATLDDDTGTELPPTFCKTTKLSAVGDRWQFLFIKEGTFRVELRNGTAVWDWMRLTISNKLTSGWKDYQAVASGTLKVQVLWTKEPPAQNPLQYYALVATMLLKQHGLALDIKPGLDFVSSARLEFEKDIVASPAGNLDDLHRKLKQNIEYNKGERLMVVLGPARQHTDADKDPGDLAGKTVSSADTGIPGNPFIVLNVNHTSRDGATLLHEMCHVAGFQDHNFEDPTNVTSYGKFRNRLQRERIQELSSAFFCAH